MDQQIEELKELVRRNISVAEDTNKLVHSMRRSARMGSILRWGWWIFLFAVSGFTYYYYVQPYVEQLQHLYASAQAGGEQAQSFGKMIADFFAQFAPK